MAAIIGPQTEEVRHALVKAAASIGLPATVVQTYNNGFRVPSSVAGKYEKPEPAKAAAPRKRATKKAAPPPEDSDATEASVSTTDSEGDED